VENFIGFFQNLQEHSENERRQKNLARLNESGVGGPYVDHPQGQSPNPIAAQTGNPGNERVSNALELLQRDVNAVADVLGRLMKVPQFSQVMSDPNAGGLVKVLISKVSSAQSGASKLGSELGMSHISKNSFNDQGMSAVKGHVDRSLAMR